MRRIIRMMSTMRKEKVCGQSAHEIPIAISATRLSTPFESLQRSFALRYSYPETRWPRRPTTAAPTQPSTTPAAPPAVKLPPEQLDSLVAPIALYPDPLLTQTLVASTYPLEVIQLKQWLDQHKELKDKALADAVQKEDWDPSIQSMAALPDVVKQLADNIKWTADLGNAFLAQQNDVMDAVQRMRKKASDGGNLKSSEQQKVETKVIENKQVIVIEQANPQVIYVPSYNPTVVYGAPVYPYPPIYYPPVGYYAAGMAISFGIGVAMGAFWGGVAGVTVAGGVVAITSISITTTISTAATETTSAMATSVTATWQWQPWQRQSPIHSNLPRAAAAIGNTIRSTVAAPLTGTEILRIDSAVVHAAIPWPTDRQVHGRTKIRELGNSPREACRTVAPVPAQAPGI